MDLMGLRRDKMGEDGSFPHHHQLEVGAVLAVWGYWE